jgi:hypothetical protein
VYNKNIYIYIYIYRERERERADKIIIRLNEEVVRSIKIGM